MSESLAVASVGPHLRCLRYCGFCRLQRSHTGRRLLYSGLRHILHSFYRLFVLFVLSLYLLQECIFAYKERHDMEKFSRVMFLLLCHVTSLAKQFVFHIDADRIDQLINSLHDPMLRGMKCSWSRELLSSCCRGARRLQRGYALTALLTCTLWGLLPALQRFTGQRVEFPVWIPFDYQHPALFSLVLLYSYYVTSVVGIANTTMDAFMGTILYQCQTQLSILRIKFASLVERAEERTKDTGEDVDQITMALFVECLKHDKKITEIVRLLQDIFGGAILIQFGIGGWILCMAAYKIVSLNVLSIEFASMILFISCILTELFIYCYYGNEVTVEYIDTNTSPLGEVLVSIYCASWLRCGVRMRRALVLGMERAHRPLRPAACHLIPLSLDTFLKVLKSSYSFYAVLRQTK